jgi:hypothetical protein
MKRKNISDESIIVLDNMDSQWYCTLMARLKDILAGLGSQLEADSEQVSALRVEQEALRSAHVRFQELSEVLEPKQERLDIVVGLLFNRPLKVKANAVWTREDEEAAKDAARYSKPIPISSGQIDLSKVPLWKIMREIVRHGAQMRIVNLQNTLKAFGFNVRRQTIESALATHKKEFQIIPRGRERYVSLK